MLQVPEPGAVFPALPIKPLEPFLRDGSGKLYVRILGCNGSGKSTFGRALRATDPEAFNFIGERGTRRLGTIFPNLGWGAVGPYTGRGGGADNLKIKELIFEALYRLAGTGLHILIEGMAVTNARWRYWEADLGMQHNFGRKPLLIYLDYPLEECLRRIYARNGGRAIREEKVSEIARGVRKTVRLYAERIAAGAPVTLRAESSLGAGAMVEALTGQMRELYGADIFAENGTLSLRG